MTNIEIGHRIKKLRELRNFSQKYMADKLNLTQQTYSKMETGDIDFPVSRIKNVAKILEIKPEDIFMFDEKALFSNNNCTFLGDNVTAIATNHNLIQELQRQNERLLQEKDKRIADLEKQIATQQAMIDKLLK